MLSRPRDLGRGTPANATMLTAACVTIGAAMLSACSRNQANPAPAIPVATTTPTVEAGMDTPFAPPTRRVTTPRVGITCHSPKHSDDVATAHPRGRCA